MARGPFWGIRHAARVLVVLLVVVAGPQVRAHDGPPFPIVSDRVSGAYRVSVWTDPDTTDNGLPGGQFWVMVEPAAPGTLPRQTGVGVLVAPLDRPGPQRAAPASPVDGDVSRQFVALVMDHEGRFDVRVTIQGPLGVAEVRSEVEATYDLRPGRFMLALSLVPFLLVGILWAKRLRQRRAPVASRPARPQRSN